MRRETDAELHPQPIHFDVFMQLATDAGLVPARKLGVAKSRVRAFLDKMVRPLPGHLPRVNSGMLTT